MPYVELHLHSNYSLLDGASHPEELATRARDLGMPALAVTDHDGLYGAVRFVKACRTAGVKPLVGAELTLEGGAHVVLLAENDDGYSSLCRLISGAQLANAKGMSRLPFDSLVGRAGGLICLSGCRNGEVASLLIARRFADALAAAGRYREVFGPDRFFVELQRHSRTDDAWLDMALTRLAARLDLRCVATNDVHYHVAERRPLQDILVCIRTHTTLDRSNRHRRPNGELYLKSDAEMRALFADRPDAVDLAGEIAERCDVTLDFGAYRFPAFDLPAGETAFSYLYSLCHAGARRLYHPVTPVVLNQLAHELSVIEKLNLSGYFLIVWDIVRFARERGILAQGRGSAANSIVAYCLGITNVDPIKLELLFERFLSEERAGTPDIDIDFANSRREEVIQYVYRKYGADYAAMVCAVNTFQARSAVRDVGKALGLPLPALDRVAKSLKYEERRVVGVDEAMAPELAAAASGPQWGQLFALCREIDDFPRHLSIHVGGMIITARPLVELVPLERATMPGRVVCQYDKDDVEELGLVKIDILALGMLSLVGDCLELVERGRGVKIDLATLPLDDPRVYDLLCRADTVGVFQIESRAQMATLPRTQPRTFYDIVTEVAIIRPGPIQGQMVNPFIRRRQGKEEVTYLHPCLEPILKKTEGVVLFQEQVIRVAMVAAGFRPGEADLLRRAMGGHRSHDKMAALRERFVAGCVATNGMTEATGAELFRQLEGFAAYGFPESHAAAFAKIVYDSSFLKLYYAPEFYCALLNNWPMGFYHPSVIVGDAKRHDVPMLPIDVNSSRTKCTVELTETGRAVRLGYRYARGIGDAALASLDAAAADGPYTSLADFCRRTRLERGPVENLIAVGAFDCLGEPRRQLLWQLPEALQAAREGELPDIAVLSRDVDLPEMMPLEEAQADYQVLGLSTAYHVMEFYRPYLDEPRSVARGLVPRPSQPQRLVEDGPPRYEREKGDASSTGETLCCGDLATLPDGRWVRVAGVAVCRQAPPTARGHVFLTIEDETGLGNVIVRPNVYEPYRQIIRHGLVMVIEGVLQNQEGVVSIMARHFESLRLPDLDPPPSRDFH